MRVLVAIFVVGALLVAACDTAKPNSSAEDQRKASIEQRAQTFDQAEKSAPLPKPQNFPMRRALIDYTNRQDLVNHPWYIYVLGDNGNTFGYFVGKTYPQSTCNFLSSTEIVRENRGDNGSTAVVLTAPSLDGIYYGGGGSKGGGCDYFFFDAGTNAMQVIHHDIKWFVSDAPLALNVQPIKVAQ